MWTRQDMKHTAVHISLRQPPSQCLAVTKTWQSVRKVRWPSLTPVLPSPPLRVYQTIPSRPTQLSWARLVRTQTRFRPPEARWRRPPQSRPRIPRRDPPAAQARSPSPRKRQREMTRHCCGVLMAHGSQVGGGVVRRKSRRDRRAGLRLQPALWYGRLWCRRVVTGAVSVTTWMMLF